ncbi:trimeric intracellular cation channel family protein [Pontibacillus yanchengensis]|uniref:Membrane protein n=1 Tax=Pontibacillus yanchengensis Y32 TaxID=1385514 RepID=A0A0A2T648_9BACI|nr:trimeric intracellular cation channel family protein [Pontibacillus yanchengensis]KGP70969.1 membrane protein [Pontibacillus yanchengensis Y32]
MAWDFLNFVAVAAFAFSGAIVAMSERYDIFGVIILGIATPFAGGIARNLFLQQDVVHIWEQGIFLYVAVGTIMIVYFFPKGWVMFWNRWNVYLDAFGLSAFAIQGALFAMNNHLPVGAVLFSAIITGVGGGVTRDVLAQRRPMVLHTEIYAVWALFAGAVIAFGIIDYTNSIQLYILFGAIITLRLLSFHMNWHLRFRDLYRI